MTYVHAQMNNRSVVRKDLKSKSADIERSGEDERACDQSRLVVTGRRRNACGAREEWQVVRMVYKVNGRATRVFSHE